MLLELRLIKGIPFLPTFDLKSFMDTCACPIKSGSEFLSQSKHSISNGRCQSALHKICNGNEIFLQIKYYHSIEEKKI